MMADIKKNPDKQSERVDGKVQDAEPGPQEWRLGGVFWGLLFVTIGVLALLNNFGYIALNMAALWQLWPLLIIVWGVSLLRFKGMLWKVVAVVLMVATLAFVSWVAVDGAAFRNQQSIVPQRTAITRAAQEIENVDLAVDSGAGKITINSKDMSEIVKADLYSNVSTLHHTSSRKGNRQQIEVKTEGTNGWWIGGVRNDLDILVSRQFPLVLSLTSGASELRADLSELRLEKLSLDLGATSADIRLGDNAKQLNVSLDAGASSVDLQIPSQSGVRVELDEGLSSKGLRGFEIKGEGVYETSNYSTAANQVVIRGSIGATSFTVDRY